LPLALPGSRRWRLLRRLPVALGNGCADRDAQHCQILPRMTAVLFMLSPSNANFKAKPHRVRLQSRTVPSFRLLRHRRFIGSIQSALRRLLRIRSAAPAASSAPGTDPRPPDDLPANRKCGPNKYATRRSTWFARGLQRAFKYARAHRCPDSPWPLPQDK